MEQLWISSEPNSPVPMDKPPTCRIRCNKFFLLLFNTLFFMTGVVLCVVGIWCLAGQGKTVLTALVPNPSLMPTMVILLQCLTGAGVIVLLTSLLGTWATLTDSCCGLTLYIILVVLVICTQVAVGVFSTIHQSRTVTSVTDTLLLRIQADYGVPNHEEFTVAVDYVQYQLQCCGIENHKDWMASRWLLGGAGEDSWQVPLTCCRLKPYYDAHINPKPLNMTVCQHQEEDVFMLGRNIKGCARRVQSWVQAEMGLIAGVAAGVTVLELGGIIAAGALCRRVSV